MVKVITSVKIENELKEKAKKLGINISKTLEEALESKTGLLSGESLEYLESERQRIEAEYKTLKEKYELDLKLIENRINELKKQQEQLQTIKSHPLIQETLQIIKQDPRFLEGRIRLIKAKTGFEISKALLLAWVKENA